MVNLDTVITNRNTNKELLKRMTEIATDSIKWASSILDISDDMAKNIFVYLRAMDNKFTIRVYWCETYEDIPVDKDAFRKLMKTFQIAMNEIRIADMFAELENERSNNAYIRNM